MHFNMGDNCFRWEENWFMMGRLCVYEAQIVDRQIHSTQTDTQYICAIQTLWGETRKIAEKIPYWSDNEKKAEKYCFQYR